MESFVFSYPTRVYFGSGAAKQALDSELGAYKKVMLAYGVASARPTVSMMRYAERLNPSARR